MDTEVGHGKTKDWTACKNCQYKMCYSCNFVHLILMQSGRLDNHTLYLSRDKELTKCALSRRASHHSVNADKEVLRNRAFRTDTVMRAL